MNDVYIVYTAFMYMLAFGMTCGGLADSGRMSIREICGMYLCLALAPITAPILLGLLIHEKCK